MQLSEYKDTHSWQDAMRLGPHLMKLAEEMPATEELGLSWQLRQAMVEIPATIAADLVHGNKPGLMPLLKLVAALELIDKVYPALDTASAKAASDKLADRLLGEDFDEPTRSHAGAAGAEVKAEQGAGGSVHEGAEHHEPADVGPAAEPSSVPVLESAPPAHPAASPAHQPASASALHSANTPHPPAPASHPVSVPVQPSDH